MEIWQLYLLTIFGNASEVFRGLSALSAIVASILAASPFVLFVEYDEERAKPFRDYAKKAVVCFFVFSLLCIFTPTERQIYTILGGYFATNIDGIEKLPPNAVKAANKFIEDYIADEKTDDK